MSANHPPPRSPRLRRPIGLGLALVLAGAPGCGERPRSIVPDPVAGRRILERALGAWKAGQGPGMLADGEAPQVQVIDSYRVPGQRLVGHRIVGEQATERARTFAVQLDLEPPAERPMVRFLLVGIDPVLVFRDRDYELLTHFEHKMDPADSPETPADGAGAPAVPSPP